MLGGCSGYRVFDTLELPNIEVKPGGELVSQVEPNFLSIQRNIIQAKCLGCHTAGGDAELVPLETLEDLTLNPVIAVVIPGDPENSPLMKVLQPDAEKRMPPRSSSITPLTTEQIAAIREWIQTGASAL